MMGFNRNYKDDIYIDQVRLRVTIRIHIGSGFSMERFTDLGEVKILFHSKNPPKNPSEKNVDTEHF